MIRFVGWRKTKGKTEKQENRTGNLYGNRCTQSYPSLSVAGDEESGMESSIEGNERYKNLLETEGKKRGMWKKRSGHCQEAKFVLRTVPEDWNESSRPPPSPPLSLPLLLPTHTQRHPAPPRPAPLSTPLHPPTTTTTLLRGVLRNQETATRTGKGEEYVKHCTAKFWRTPPQLGCGRLLFLRGGRRSRSGTPWSRSSAPCLTLDAPVPLMVGQLPDILHFFDALLPVAEQATDVPKIFLEDIPSRTPVREPQLAEQLVEVTTILSFVKQTVDIPVPRGGGRRLQGFLPELNPTAVRADR